MTKKPAQQTQREKNFWAQLWRESLVATSLGWNLAVPIFAGVLVGHLLDRWIGTRYVFTLGLLLLGVTVGYYNLGSFIHRLNQHEKRRKAALEDDETENKDDAIS